MPKTRKILVIRHAEKTSDDGLPPRGINIDGALDPKSLIPRGWQRAGALAPFFGPAVGSPVRHLDVPQVLFASNPNNDGSNRPIETITPLSQRLALPLNTNHTKGEESQLVEDAKAQNGVVLICWQHERIANIANAILGNTRAPQHWPSSRFDVVWIFKLDKSSGRYALRQIPQQLLSGDDDTVIS